VGAVRLGVGSLEKTLLWDLLGSWVSIDHHDRAALTMSRSRLPYLEPCCDGDQLPASLFHGHPVGATSCRLSQHRLDLAGANALASARLPSIRMGHIWSLFSPRLAFS